jgi:Uma2 family endonuclease
MVMPNLANHSWTREDLARLPDDGNRYEVLDGELLVTPAPSFRHQLVATQLALALESYCRAMAIGVVVTPGAVVWSHNELIPDIVVFGGDPAELRTLDWGTLPTPLLVVEVASPGTQRRDRSVKRRTYLESLGIPAYWLVDPVAETIEALSTTDRPYTVGIGDTLVWSPPGAAEPFALPLAALFRPA